jgi:hypothetical protein
LKKATLKRMKLYKGSRGYLIRIGSGNSRV